MMQTHKIVLYGIAALLMALPGFFTVSRKPAYLACMLMGLVLIGAAGKGEFAKPRTALIVLVISNLSFWLSVACWLFRDRLLTAPSREAGVDPFVGPLLLWLAVFLLLMIYELAVFAIGVVTKADRNIAAVGVVAVVAQILVTARSIYLMIQGV